MEKIYTPKIATFLMLFMAFGSAKAAENVVFTTGLQVQPVTTTSTVSRLYLDILDSAGIAAQTLIVYMSPCTEGIDYGFDASIFPQSNVTSIYTIVEDYHLIIQALPEFNDSGNVVLGYTASAAGTYTININHYEGVFSEGQNVYIKDNLNGITTNLSEGSYSFTSTAGEFNDRFHVQYTPNALGTDAVTELNSNVTVFQNAGGINIKSDTATITGITLYDINGRKLHGKSGLNLTEIVIDAIEAKKQLLIIQIYTSKGMISKKIVF
ncbi:hypothetical protein ACLI1A_04860 [Flavobacterium sp. RHBU_3]|uniref:hypothetical protein n=1 Tax=Flavobacterium sp. RHBU_3 TaxID=3391184 RepID=UPI0039850BF3